MKFLLKIIFLPIIILICFLTSGFWSTLFYIFVAMLVYAAIIDHGVFKRRSEIKE